MSGGLVPSRSTVYLSNLPFDLKNNDLHKLFEKYGRIVKVTILKDKSRRSRGVAFVLFLNVEDAKACVAEMNCKQMFGRMLKASIAKDNGRTTEFIRRRDYPDKSKCFECGESGHLSYKCSKNLLGDREPPPKKMKKKKRKPTTTQEELAEYFQSTDEERDCEEEEEEEEVESLSAAIALETKKRQLEDADCNKSNLPVDEGVVKKRIKVSSYFSDEEESE